MAKDFILPDLGEGIHEAQVVNVLVAEGDTVKEDQAVMEVETDKAAVELPVPYAGKIEKLNVKVGDTVKVGQVLLSVGGGASGAESAEKPAAKAEAPAKPAAPSPAPAPKPSAPAPAAKPSTPAPAAKPAPDEEDEPQDWSEAPLESAGAASAAAKSPRTSAPAPAAEIVHGEGPVPAAPAVRRYAREVGVDLRQVRGTGSGGRVIREDVERMVAGGAAQTAVAEAPQTRSAPSKSGAGAPAMPGSPAPIAKSAAAAAPRPAVAAEPLPDFSQWGAVRREAIPQIRKAISRQMTRSWTLIPHVTHGDEADVTELEAFRKEQGKIFTEQGAKLTLTAFVLKAVVGALQQFPQFNTSFDDAAGEMIYKDYFHLGVAVDTPRGLMVPVLRDVDRKGLARISKELSEIAQKARDFKIDLADLRGGTFTVTNIGSLGGKMATPMINYPEVAILGLGKMEWKPVVREGQIVPRLMLPLFLSFDHRVIDGADAARFTNTIMSYLENPLNLLLVG